MTEIPPHRRTGLPTNYFPSGAGEYRAINWERNPPTPHCTIRAALSALKNTKPHIRRGVLADLINLKDDVGYVRNLAHEVLLLVVRAEFNDKLLRKLLPCCDLGESTDETN